ncbi:ParA family protein [Ramlibacter sp. PS4R-6]|uniref:ParA family protein n=1 Tax=Ramlibacter sp. PS4R-6 TaxID=3133438 RepID=UPI0030966163
MPVIAVVNRKGGSGKSTFAAHVAAWCARAGHAVMLGDVDRQQSSRNWLRRRPSDLPAIAPWAMDQNTLRVPTGISHVVLDTPGGLHGFELARVVMFADAIVMPVCPSMFDRESAALCHAELMALPRVANGRCRIGVVGMRIDGRTNGAEVMRAWADAMGIPFLGVLRETTVYTRALERGLTIFDVKPAQVATDLGQWQSILEWLEPVISPPQAANDGPVIRTQAPTRIASARPENLMPAQDSLVHGTRLSGVSATRTEHRAVAGTLAGSRTQVPQFLKR